MNNFKLVKPVGRRRLWRVEGYVGDKLTGTWSCDSEEIARAVLRRLKAGDSPRWVAHDLRHSREPRESTQR